MGRLNFIVFNYHYKLDIKLKETKKRRKTTLKSHIHDYTEHKGW